MDIEKLKQVLDYSDVFSVIAGGKDSVSEIDEELKLKVSNSSALTRRRKWLAESPAYLTIENGQVIFDVKTLSEDIDELRKLIIPKDYEQNSVYEKEAEIDMLRRQVNDLTSEIQENSRKISQQEDYISKLKAEQTARTDDHLKTELGRKVLVASSISVGPKVHATDECFLMDPDDLLDVDACVARYGGELDSFYDEIPTDEDCSGFEPGHELTERNHALRTMKTVGTKRFFKKRINDNAVAKATELRVGQLFPGHCGSKSERQRERDKILHNRFVSLNNIIKCDRLTNQEKLMMYAMNSEYHNTHIERLLNYAGNHCINANFLIDILEDPDVCTTYENTVAFLSQFADASEYRMKLNLARELIEGKWYITADYNGRITKFQLVPIEEFNELREAAGLPASKFSYKGIMNSDKDMNNKDTPDKPDFVERITGGSYPEVDLPDDGFRMPPMDDNEND